MTTKERLIKKLYANQCSKEELNSLFNLLQEDASGVAPIVMQELLYKMQEVPELETTTADRIMNRVLEKTNNLDPQLPKSKLQLTARKRFGWIKYAAAILLLVMASWFTLEFINNTPREILVETGFGEQQSLELPDGSLVKLNANSSLTFPKKWDDQENRKVWLQGEAFFEVEKKPVTNQKFQVITKDLTIEVLGTQFNVNSHQIQTEVFLEEGKVNLKLDGLTEGMLMSPGQIVAYSKEEKKVPVKRQLVATNYPSWKDGIILFRDATLTEVIEKFNELYGVSIKMKNTKDYTRKITTGIPVDNQKEAIRILEITLGDSIIIVGEHDNK